MGVRLFLLAVLVLVGCERHMSRTPNIYLDGSRDVFDDVPPERRSSKVEVLYVTDRVPSPDVSVNYGWKRSPSMAWGSGVVEFGRDLTWEQLVEATLADRRDVTLKLRSVNELGRFPDDPPRLALSEDDEVVKHPEFVAASREATDAFLADVRRRLAVTPTRSVVVVVHGFNVDFNTAVCSGAEGAHFLRHAMLPIVYSWPGGSRMGLLRGYTYDRESSQFTVYHFKQLIRKLAACEELREINIIAHSRGNGILMAAARELAIEARAAGGDARERFKLGNLVLVAPDLDWEVTYHRTTSEEVFRLGRRQTFYVAAGDTALGLSNWLFASQRRLGEVTAGDLTPEQDERMGLLDDTYGVEVRTDGGSFGHSYYKDPEVMSDLILMLLGDRDPGPEHGRPLEWASPTFWILNEGYPDNGDEAVTMEDSGK